MTTKNTCSLLILVTVATAIVCTSAVVCTSAPSPAPANPTPSPCPWRRVPPEDPFIQKLGSWTVDQEHAVMHFIKVERARWQGVGQPCGSMFFHNYYYELIIVVSIRGLPGDPGGDDEVKYRAVVYVVNFSQPQKVIFFSRFSPAAN